MTISEDTTSKPTENQPIYTNQYHGPTRILNILKNRQVSDYQLFTCRFLRRIWPSNFKNNILRYKIEMSHNFRPANQLISWVFKAPDP